MRIKHVLVLMVLVLSSCGQVTDALGSIGETKLQTAMKSCATDYSGYAQLMDDGKTVSIDGAGKDSEGAPIEELICILNATSIVASTLQLLYYVQLNTI